MARLNEGSIRRADRKYVATFVLEDAPILDCANAPNESSDYRRMSRSRSAANAANVAGGYRGSRTHTL